MIRSLIAGLAMLTLVTGCSAGAGAASVASSPASKPTFMTYPPNFSVGPLPSVTLGTYPPTTPEPDPTDVTGVYRAGETVALTQNDDPWADITVSKVKVVRKYDGPYDLDDIPAKGNVYIQALVTYVAKTNGVDYNPFDWQVFVAGEAVSDTGYVSNGPTPELSSGTLPTGRKASGWVVYEVPAHGEVRMSYGNTFSNDAPVFEIIIRTS
jgi:hypothetical protein